MKFWVGVTDNSWFKFLADREAEEANFWRPKDTSQFRVLQPGGLFLFKLHSPHNFIVGGGHFVHHSVVPLSLAWESFGEANGATDILSLTAMIQRVRGDSERDPVIGCTVLNNLFYFPQERWIPVPGGWAKNIVKGMSYDTEVEPGRGLWLAVRERLIDVENLQAVDVAENGPRYGEEYLARARLGQGAFRLLVTDAYERRCALTGERTLPVLQAAHIKPYAEEGAHSVANGLLMKSDLHILFDRGYVTVTPEYRIEVSKRIREEFENGRDYYALHGKELKVLPRSELLRPDRALLGWHNERVFMG